jgi:DNA polymerase-3 subunit beta
VNIELTGDEVTVALRPALLIDGLAGINTEYVKIGFTKSANPGKPGPILLTNHGAKKKTVNDGYRYLLQPYPQIAKRAE